jgi:hypothetical protein
LADHLEGVTSMAFSSDGRRLLTWTSAKTLHTWDVATGKELTHFACGGRDTQPEPAAFSPDRALLAWAERYGVKTLAQIRLIRVASGREVRRLPGPNSSYLCVAFSPDGRNLAATDQAGTQIHVWEVASGKERRQLVGHRGQVLGDAVRPAIRQALTGAPSLEVRRRLETILESLDKQMPSADQLRQLRAVEVLEHIGSPHARQVLDRLANGAVEARITNEAKASFERLAQRRERDP